MLSDRDYMRGPLEEESSGWGGWHLSGNHILMLVLVAGFFLDAILQKFSGIDLKGVFGLSPEGVVEEFKIWQPLTYLFFHPDPLMVLIFNLIGLFFFGPIVESYWGRRKYIYFFLCAGVFAGLVVTPLAYMERLSQITILGASGSVLAVLVAAALINPDLKVLLFFVIPIKIKYMILLFLGFDFLILIKETSRAYGHAIPHLAGALFGFLYFRYAPQIDQFFAGLEPSFEESPGREPPRSSVPDVKNEEIDRILDKINNEGINSLTPKERELLEEASERMNKMEEEDLERFREGPR